MSMNERGPGRDVPIDLSTEYDVAETTWQNICERWFVPGSPASLQLNSTEAARLLLYISFLRFQLGKTSVR